MTENGKLRNVTLSFYDQGQNIIFLRQWQKHVFLNDTAAGKYVLSGNYVTGKDVFYRRVSDEKKSYTTLVYK